MGEELEDLTISGNRRLKDLKVLELKCELEKRGLPKYGTKKDLLQRLASFEELKQKSLVANSKSETPNQWLEDDSNLANDFIRDYFRSQKALLAEPTEYKNKKGECDAPATIHDSSTTKESSLNDAKPSCSRKASNKASNKQHETILPEPITARNRGVKLTIRTKCDPDISSNLGRQSKNNAESKILSCSILEESQDGEEQEMYHRSRRKKYSSSISRPEEEKKPLTKLLKIKIGDPPTILNTSDIKNHHSNPNVVFPSKSYLSPQNAEVSSSVEEPTKPKSLQMISPTLTERLPLDVDKLLTCEGNKEAKLSVKNYTKPKIVFTKIDESKKNTTNDISILKSKERTQKVPSTTFLKAKCSAKLGPTTVKRSLRNMLQKPQLVKSKKNSVLTNPSKVTSKISEIKNLSKTSKPYPDISNKVIGKKTYPTVRSDLFESLKQQIEMPLHMEKNPSGEKIEVSSTSELSEQFMKTASVEPISYNYQAICKQTPISDSQIIVESHLGINTIPDSRTCNDNQIPLVDPLQINAKDLQPNSIVDKPLKTETGQNIVDVFGTKSKKDNYLMKNILKDNELPSYLPHIVDTNLSVQIDRGQVDDENCISTTKNLILNEIPGNQRTENCDKNIFEPKPSIIENNANIVMEKIKSADNENQEESIKRESCSSKESDESNRTKMDILEAATLAADIDKSYDSKKEIYNDQSSVERINAICKLDPKFSDDRNELANVKVYVANDLIGSSSSPVVSKVPMQKVPLIVNTDAELCTKSVNIVKSEKSTNVIYTKVLSDNSTIVESQLNSPVALQDNLSKYASIIDDTKAESNMQLLEHIETKSKLDLNIDSLKKYDLKVKKGLDSKCYKIDNIIDSEYHENRITADTKYNIRDISIDLESSNNIIDEKSLERNPIGSGSRVINTTMNSESIDTNTTLDSEIYASNIILDAKSQGANIIDSEFYEPNIIQGPNPNVDLQSDIKNTIDSEYFEMNTNIDLKCPETKSIDLESYRTNIKIESKSLETNMDVESRGKHAIINSTACTKDSIIYSESLKKNTNIDSEATRQNNSFDSKTINNLDFSLINVTIHSQNLEISTNIDPQILTTNITDSDALEKKAIDVKNFETDTTITSESLTNIKGIDSETLARNTISNTKSLVSNTNTDPKYLGTNMNDNSKFLGKNINVDSETPRKNNSLDLKSTTNLDSSLINVAIHSQNLELSTNIDSQILTTNITGPDALEKKSMDVKNCETDTTITSESFANIKGIDSETLLRNTISNTKSFVTNTNTDPKYLKTNTIIDFKYVKNKFIDSESCGANKDTDSKSVTDTNIDSKSVTNTNIDSKSVTNISSKLVRNVNIDSESVTNTNIDSKSVTNTNIDSKSVTNTNIDSKSVTNTNIDLKSLGAMTMDLKSPVAKIIMDLESGEANTNMNSKTFENKTSIDLKSFGEKAKMNSEFIRKDSSVDSKVLGINSSIGSEVIGKDYNIKFEVLGGKSSINSKTDGRSINQDSESFGTKKFEISRTKTINSTDEKCVLIDSETHMIINSETPETINSIDEKCVLINSETPESNVVINSETPEINVIIDSGDHEKNIIDSGIPEKNMIIDSETSEKNIIDSESPEKNIIDSKIPDGNLIIDSETSKTINTAKFQSDIINPETLKKISNIGAESPDKYIHINLEIYGTNNNIESKSGGADTSIHSESHPINTNTDPESTEVNTNIDSQISEAKINNNLEISEENTNINSPSPEENINIFDSEIPSTTTNIDLETCESNTNHDLKFLTANINIESQISGANNNIDLQNFGGDPNIDLQIPGRDTTIDLQIPGDNIDHTDSQIQRAKTNSDSETCKSNSNYDLKSFTENSNIESQITGVNTKICSQIPAAKTNIDSETLAANSKIDSETIVANSNIDSEILFANSDNNLLMTKRNTNNDLEKYKMKDIISFTEGNRVSKIKNIQSSITEPNRTLPLKFDLKLTDIVSSDTSSQCMLSTSLPEVQTRLVEVDNLCFSKELSVCERKFETVLPISSLPMVDTINIVSDVAPTITNPSTVDTLICHNIEEHSNKFSLVEMGKQRKEKISKEDHKKSKHSRDDASPRKESRKKSISIDKETEKFNNDRVHDVGRKIEDPSEVPTKLDNCMKPAEMAAGEIDISEDKKLKEDVKATEESKYELEDHGRPRSKSGKKESHRHRLKDKRKERSASCEKDDLRKHKRIYHSDRSSGRSSHKLTKANDSEVITEKPKEEKIIEEKSVDACHNNDDTLDIVLNSDIDRSLLEEDSIDLLPKVKDTEQSKTKKDKHVKKEERKEVEKETVPFKSVRKVSVNSNRSKVNDESKKRKWGSSKNSKPSIDISSFSLKSLIPDVKPLSPSELKFGSEESSDGEKTPIESLKKVNGRMDSNKKEELSDSRESSPLKNDISRKSSHQSKENTHDSRKEKRSRRHSDRRDSSQSHRRNYDAKVDVKQSRSIQISMAAPLTKLGIPPSRNITSRIITVSNLVRPFTVKQLKDLLQRTGTLVENGFWIDNIKSKCIAMFEEEDQAVETRIALYGVKWPSVNPKSLLVDFTTETDLKKKLQESPHLNPIIVDDAKFSRKKADGPVREWDLAKLGERSPGERERERERERTDREHERKRERRKEQSPRIERTAGKKTVKVKSLDDLFSKTLAQPSIYWLPLSDVEIAEKEFMRRKKMAEQELREAEMKAIHERQRAERIKERQRRRSRTPVRRSRRSPSSGRRRRSKSRSRSRS